MPEVYSRSEADRTPSYDGRRFRLTLTGGVPTSRNVVLECRQFGDVVVGTYSGQNVEHGALLAIVRAMGGLDGRFQHVAVMIHHETGRCWAYQQHMSGR